MRELDEEALDEATKPALEALRALPDTDVVRRGISDVLVFQHVIGG
jgi:hypothetical protein